MASCIVEAIEDLNIAICSWVNYFPTRGINTAEVARVTRPVKRGSHTMHLYFGFWVVAIAS